VHVDHDLGTSAYVIGEGKCALPGVGGCGAA